MCSETVVAFVAEALQRAPLRGKRVVEFGSCRSLLRPLVESYAVDAYVGVDIQAGPGVDVVGRVEDAEARFGREAFDLVLSTETLEHVRDWRATVRSMKAVLRPNGEIILTTRSRGFPLHLFPRDYWRFETEDMTRIFSDFGDVRVRRDPKDPGVFVHAREKGSSETDLEPISLYSVLHGDRRPSIAEDYDTQLLSRLKRLQYRATVKLQYYLWRVAPR